MFGTHVQKVSVVGVVIALSMSAWLTVWPGAGPAGALLLAVPAVLLADAADADADVALGAAAEPVDAGALELVGALDAAAFEVAAVLAVLEEPEQAARARLAVAARAVICRAVNRRPAVR